MQKKGSEKMKEQNLRLRFLAEGAALIALATVLSIIIIYKAPYGGSLTLFSMVPIIMISVRHGVKNGLFAAFVYSIIQLLLGLSNFSYIPSWQGIAASALFDYIFAFTVLGFAGMFVRTKAFSGKYGIYGAVALGSAITVIARTVIHMFASVFIWRSLWLEWYADDPTNIVNRFSPWMFALIYNISYMLPELVLTLVATPVVASLYDFGMKNKKEEPEKNNE